MPLAPLKDFWLSGSFEEIVPVPPRVKRIGKPALILHVEEDYLIKGDLVRSKIYNYIINGYVTNGIKKHLSLYGNLESYVDDQYKLTIDMFYSFIEELSIEGNYENYIEKIMKLTLKRDLSGLYWEIILNDENE